MLNVYVNDVYIIRIHNTPLTCGEFVLPYYISTTLKSKHFFFTLNVFLFVFTMFFFYIFTFTITIAYYDISINLHNILII